MHYVVPLALFLALRNVLLAYILIYVFETLEQLLSRIPGLQRTFQEARWDDSWIGDPLMGGTAVTGAAIVTWLLQIPETSVPPLYARVIFFALVALPTIFIADNDPPPAQQYNWSKPRVFIHACYTVALLFATFGPYIGNNNNALLGTLVAAIAIFVQGIIATFGTTSWHWATYKRVFVLNATLLLAALTTLLVCLANGSFTPVT